ncbi:uncharacterized protein AMSG_00099 [Thecamonas trahens ATCC 50062]|uniref:EF-hand domain-containing protein n=1 Tax=Thecamonas trahens ATCC 50062 TaxID=461836 RepID=A0A0L0D155_THETB|nr:hypothetical protein AMSG_00099 [Thecamonas trahens ATCC 50062]KNC45982.1 hypothetical protein AMSG_00099 [Thecamonas trahens ATCC 50062]|eukprot:XP_013762963.1 hypothetical protein AMSG_00099 [Thecamonas trahens ATCC 50062]
MEKALLTPDDIEHVHRAFAEADPRQTGLIDVWAFKDLVETMPWELSDYDMYELLASVEKDGRGRIAFPAVLKAVDDHVRARVEESADFDAAWAALGGSFVDVEGTRHAPASLDSPAAFEAFLPADDQAVTEAAAQVGMPTPSAAAVAGSGDKISVDGLLRACKRYDLALNVSDLIQFSTAPELSFDEFRSFVLTGSLTGNRAGVGASSKRPKRLRRGNSSGFSRLSSRNLLTASNAGDATGAARGAEEDSDADGLSSLRVVVPS